MLLFLLFEKQFAHEKIAFNKENYFEKVAKNRD